MNNPARNTATATAKAGSPSSKAGRDDRYCVVAYVAGRFAGVMSGMGRNRGTWDSDHSRRAARKHARELRQQHPEMSFVVQPS